MVVKRRYGWMIFQRWAVRPLAIVFLFAGLTSLHAQHYAVSPTFSVAPKSVVDFEKISRRKFGKPVVADLDQDGWPDLILTEHAKHARVFWNNSGSFSKPVTLIRGDTHGVSVGDIDRDGVHELIVIPGGGGGKKPSSPILIDVGLKRKLKRAAPLTGFQNSRGRTGKLIDVDNDGKLELITTAFEGKSRGQDINFLYDDSAEGVFRYVGPLPRAARMGFRNLATDFDNDGDVDLIFYGGRNWVAARGGEGLGFIDVTAKALADVSDIDLASELTEIDFDNDGDFDLFVTRARHPFNEVFHCDEKEKRYFFFTRGRKMKPIDLTVDGDFEFENLQMAYPDFDVFLGAEKRLQKFEQQDFHGGKKFKIAAEEARGWPEDLSDNGVYIGHIGDGVWRVVGLTKSPTSMVVHNVVSQHKSTQLKKLPAVLLENRDGVFYDVTSVRRVDVPEQTTGATAGDFNNDGWTDIFAVVHGRSTADTRQVLLINEKGKGFTRSINHNIVSTELGATGNSANTFDYDRDGDLDLIFSNERGQWHLFTNDLKASENSHYIVVNVGSSPSGKASALGAVMTMHVGDNIYKRVVGGTAGPFGQGFNTFLHVGLGSAENVDQAVVRWSNGEQQTIQVQSVDQIISAGKHPANANQD